MTTRFAEHLLSGTHASRPAFGSVPQGTLYACTDHDLIYQSDGATAWTTWATLGGGGGSGSAWEVVLDVPGTAMTGLTAAGGIWASDGTIIRQTEGTAGTKWARSTNPMPLALPFVAEVDFRVPSAGQVGGANESVGILMKSAAVSGGSGSAPIVGARWDSGASSRVYWEANASALIGTSTLTLVRDTWYTLRVVAADELFLAYIDAAAVAAINLGNLAGVNQMYVGPCTQWSLKADFRNFKVWSLTQP
jgi:hypothetical protein